MAQSHCRASAKANFLNCTQLPTHLKRKKEKKSSFEPTAAQIQPEAIFSLPLPPCAVIEGGVRRPEESQTLFRTLGQRPGQQHHFHAPEKMLKNII